MIYKPINSNRLQERLSEQKNVGSDSEGPCIYLQQEVESPQTTVVQHQVFEHKVKMLVVNKNNEQRLITFEIPEEDCTVEDLLELVINNLYQSNIFDFTLIFYMKYTLI